MDVNSRRIRLALLLQIRRATQSTNPALYLEGMIARHFRDSVVQFQKVVQIGNRAIGEIDIELKTAIVEVTTGTGSGKVGQAKRLLSPALNPEGKKVIVFGPNIAPRRAQAIEAVGAHVARSIQELARLALEN